MKRRSRVDLTRFMPKKSMKRSISSFKTVYPKWFVDVGLNTYQLFFLPTISTRRSKAKQLEPLSLERPNPVQDLGPDLGRFLGQCVAWPNVFQLLNHSAHRHIAIGFTGHVWM